MCKIIVGECMKDKLYLENLKDILNDDDNVTVVFEESQTGPQEEPVLLAFDVNINRFKQYMNNLHIKRKR